MGVGAGMAAEQRSASWVQQSAPVPVVFAQDVGVGDRLDGRLPPSRPLPAVVNHVVCASGRTQRSLSAANNRSLMNVYRAWCVCKPVQQPAQPVQPVQLHLPLLLARLTLSTHG